ncbi:MAG: disulfide bond formation protein B, partial [Pseudomonadota bacterium]
VAAATLAAALISQYGFGMQPCELCVWQRWPYLPGLLAGGAALLFWDAKASTALLWVAALSFVAGSGLAVFHSGVEFGIWKGLETCSAPAPGSLSPADFLKQLEAAPLVRCSDRVPFLAGLTMANWNALITAGVALCFAAGAVLSGRERQAL